MKSILDTLSICILTFGVVVCADSTPKKTQLPPPKLAESDLSGIWVVEGYEPDKSDPYRGVCLVTQEGGTLIFAYSMYGGAQAIGVGVRSKDSIAVAWSIRSTDKRGVTHYAVDGKVMKGTWQPIPTDGHNRRETLRFVRRLED